MTQTIELLAPGGDVDSIKAAIVAGADAVYCGLEQFNARNRAENISFDQLNGILRLAHNHNVQVFLTLNIIIIESEIPAFIRLLNKLCKTSIDGIILQDLGMLYVAKKHFPELKVHGSTQLTTHNDGQIKFLKILNVNRVNLSRELDIEEIRSLTRTAHENSIMTEVFVHGSNCLSFSGLCYMSSVFEGKSGNRGMCSQPCRNQYVSTPAGKQFPLNLKDNSAYRDLADLAEAKVDSIKIEGRIKKFHYVYTVVQTWRQQLKKLYSNHTISNDNAVLYKVFNRGFTNGFLAGRLHRDMFIDNPRDNSALHLAKTFTAEEGNNLERAKKQLYAEKTEIIVAVQDKISRLNIDKAPLTITCAGQENTSLQITLITPETSITLTSEFNLRKGPAADNTINSTNLTRLLKNIKHTEYYIEDIVFNDLQSDLLLPFKQLTALKNKIFATITPSQQTGGPVTLPRLTKQEPQALQPTLSLLISSEEDLSLCQEQTEVYFQIPNCLDQDLSYYQDLFRKNEALKPWFPAVLIGEYYHRAVQLLHSMSPRKTVTNNSGIAYEAYSHGITWVAGPHLNTVNSYSLLCLKETFNCSGAFISNELNNFQLRAIKGPDNFPLYYSMYHPIVLMTSRQCLFQQITGCEKSILDSSCIKNCQRNTPLETFDKGCITVEKTKGNYHTLYNNHNYLNTDIAHDNFNMFNHFFIDLRDIETETTVTVGKKEIVQRFEDFIRGDDPSGVELRKHIQPTTHKQYKKGI